MPPSRAIFALLIGLSALALACTKTDTSVTAPTTERCSISATSSPSTFAPGGGQGSLTIVAARDCTWSVTTDASWVSIGGDRSGQGGATVRYDVAANPVPASRSTSLVIGSARVAVSQAAAACVFTLSRSTSSIGSAGGQLSVGVTTLTGCRWTATSADSWIAIASGGSGEASGTVGLSVAANTGGVRVGRVNVAGQNYTVSQDAAPARPPMPTPPPAPTPPPPPPPAPTPGQQRDFEGTVSNVSGTCPTLSFTAGSDRVKTTSSTRFDNISCSDVARGGGTVKGEGVTDSSGAIVATRVENKS